jgi:hypothetical protein
MSKIVYMIGPDGECTPLTDHNADKFLSRNPGWKKSLTRPPKAAKPEPPSRMVNSRDPDSKGPPIASPKSEAKKEPKSQSGKDGGS